MQQVILSVDCGTQSLRGLLFSPKGELLDKAQVFYTPYQSPRPGWAEQDPEVYWRALCEACLTLKKNHAAIFKKIAGVGVTTLRASMVNLDARGDPLRPVMVWLDQRKARPVYQPRGLIKLALRAVGMTEALQKAQKDGKCNWIRQNQPELWANTHKYLQVSGFLNYRLTGVFRDSVASQIGHIPFNYRARQWGRPGEWLNFAQKCFPVEPEKLPELVPPGQPIGAITAQAAAQTGLARGIPVIACGSDKGCETLGMGVLDQSTASLSFSTTATVQTTAENYFETLPFMPPYPAAIPDRYNPEVEIFRGYWMITWFKEEFAHEEVRQARSKGVPPEVVMNRLLAAAPPGVMGLVVLPCWGPGLNEPFAKGAMIGFGDVHKKAHVYRAIVEGLAFGLLDGMRRMEKRGKVVFNQAAVSGGASQSNEICQITADVIGLPLLRGRTYETSGLGAAIITTVGTGLHPSFDAAIKAMVHYDRVFRPDRSHVALYRQLFDKVYRRLYPALADIYKSIRDITGYPE